MRDINKLVKGRGVVEAVVTPEMADKILKEHNGMNRRLSNEVVEKYTSDMLSGRWKENQQNMWMAFYEDGNLADGQHRLAAIIKSGVARKMRIERGLPKEHAYGIDAHRMRQASDQMKIAGADEWIDKGAIAIAKLALVGEGRKKATVSPQELLDYCYEHEENLRFTLDVTKTKIKYLTTAPVRTAIFLASYYEDKERLAEFAHCLTTGMMSSLEDAAAIRLREKLIREANLFYSGTTGRDAALRITQRAIKAFCERDEVKKLHTPQEWLYKPVTSDEASGEDTHEKKQESVHTETAKKVANG